MSDMFDQGNTVYACFKVIMNMNRPLHLDLKLRLSIKIPCNV